MDTPFAYPQLGELLGQAGAEDCATGVASRIVSRKPPPAPSILAGMIVVPILQTDRLIIRPFTMADLDDIHRLFDSPQTGDQAGDASNPPLTLDARREWLHWMAALTGPFAGWYPLYGDRAVVLREDNRLIGAVGFVAELEPFESLPYLGGHANAPRIPEISLYWQIGEAYRRHGYATEAAQALVDFAFKELRVKRLLALAHPDNAASLGVMRKLGMYIERAQGACGILENKTAG